MRSTALRQGMALCAAIIGAALLANGLWIPAKAWLAQRLATLGVEAVYALRSLAAVTFSDLMLRRLTHAQGPCLQRDCLRRAHDLFRRARMWPVDDDFQAATSALLAEVDHISGGLLREGPAEVEAESASET